MTGPTPLPAYTDPRLVALYDTDNPPGEDHAYYRRLADELDARVILDLGCGTGTLTVALARAGRAVTGIDPSAAMLAVARVRAGGEAVTWLLGDASAIAPTGDADLAVMTGNAIQQLDRAQLAAALDALAAALRPGGVLAFETRNPAERAWETWAAEPPSRRETPDGPLRAWMEIDPPDAHGTLRMTCRTVFEANGEEVTELMELTFRDLPTLEAALRAAGFDRVDAWADWERSPFTGEGRLIVIEARRGPSTA